jgi:hypothetical protein
MQQEENKKRLTTSAIANAGISGQAVYVETFESFIYIPR